MHLNDQEISELPSNAQFYIKNLRQRNADLVEKNKLLTRSNSVLGGRVGTAEKQVRSLALEITKLKNKIHELESR